VIDGALFFPLGKENLISDTSIGMTLPEAAVKLTGALATTALTGVPPVPALAEAGQMIVQEAVNHIDGTTEQDREENNLRNKGRHDTRMSDMKSTNERERNFHKYTSEKLDKNDRAFEKRDSSLNKLSSMEDDRIEAKAMKQLQVRQMEEEAEWEKDQAQAEARLERQRFEAEKASVEARTRNQIEKHRHDQELSKKIQMAEDETKMNLTVVDVVREHKNEYHKLLMQNVHKNSKSVLDAKVKTCEKKMFKTLEAELDDRGMHLMLTMMKENKDGELEVTKASHENEGRLRQAQLAIEQRKLEQRLKHLKMKAEKEEELKNKHESFRLLCLELVEQNRQQTESITRATEMKTQRKQQLERTKEALGLTDKDMRAENGKALRGNFTKFFFLVIVLACELDTFGFLMAAQHYGQMAFKHSDWLILSSLVAGPLSYMTAISAYACFLRRKKTDGEPSGPSQETGLLPEIEKLQTNPKDFNALEFNVQSEPFHLKFYHFVPCYRSFILMKEQAPDDVEALFRINGLSTFTLGFNQLFCLLLSSFQDYPSDDNVIQYVIYANQFFNLVVTIIYFSSSIAGRMKGITKVEALKYNLRERMQRDILRYQFAMDQDALCSGEKDVQNDKSIMGDFGKPGSPGPQGSKTQGSKTPGSGGPIYGTEGTVQIFHKMIERQIKELTTMKEIDLSPFSIEEKFSIRKQLCIKQINAFIEATSV